MRSPRHLVVAALGGAALAASLVMAVPPREAGASSASSIAALATANLNKHACARNSLGGRGFGSSCTGNGGKPEYWCADFAKWVWEHSGVAFTDELNPLAGSFYTYGLENGTLTGTPAVGDAAVFNYYGGGEAEHVALVTAVYPNGTIVTTSGDWGGVGETEAKFSSTSTVSLNSPGYLGVPGAYPDTMGMTLSAFVAPVGVAVKPVVGGTAVSSPRTLEAGQSVVSPNGLYSLTVSASGQLEELAAGREVWSSGPSAVPGDRATFQRDGNLVLYSPLGKALWASHTNHSAGDSLSVEDNGRVFVSDARRVAWSRTPRSGYLASGTALVSGEKLISNGGLFTLVMQRDGNVVEYTAGRAIWSSKTARNPGAELVMQPGGALQVVSPSGKELWSTHTNDPGAGAKLFAEGALAIGTPGAKPRWRN